MSGWVPAGNGLVITATSVISLQSSIGVIAGGALTFGPGLTITVNQGSGWLLDPLTNIIKAVSWTTQVVAVAPNATQHFYIDSGGHVVVSPTVITSYAYIYLGSVTTNGLGPIVIDPVQVFVYHHANSIETMLRDTVGSVFGSGAIVSEDLSIPLTLDVTAGHYYYGSEVLQIPAATQILFTKFYNNGTGGWTTVTPTAPSYVPTDKYDDGSGTLVSIPSGQWVSHELFAVGSQSGAAQFFMVYGQAVYANATDASNAVPLQVPPYFNEGVVSLGRIIVQQGAVAVGMIVDKRPFINKGGSVSGGGGSGLTDPMTTAGDMIIRNAANITSRLGIGAQGQVLQVSGTGIPSWQDPALLGNTLGWGYQDFPAGSGPNLTLSSNENGVVSFLASQVISNSATIVTTANPEAFPYTGTTKLFSTKVVVNSQTGTAVVLNATPNVSWGQVRVYYMYNYGVSLPNGYTLAPDFINNQELTEIQALFVSEEELGTIVPYTTLGDLVYGGSTLHSNVRLPIGTAGQILTVVSGVPAWSAAPVSITIGTPANGLSLLGGVLSLALSSTSTTGALSAADWNTFNSKQSALTLGDLTGISGRTAVVGGTGAVVGAGASVDVATTLLPSPLSTDSGKVLTSTGAGTATWQSPGGGGGGSSGVKFVGLFYVASWVLVGANYQITYTAATHQMGTDPIVYVQELDSGAFTPVNDGITSIDASTGDVTLSISSSLVSQLFDGKVVIMSGTAAAFTLGFVVGSWVLNPPNYEISIPESVHGKGVSPVAEIQQLNGTEYNPVSPGIIYIDSVSGNITLRIDPSLVSQLFAGRAIIN